jgi:CDP-glucose 4,6-dehydratase
VGFREAAVEGVGVRREFWAGRRILVTGHTGFKGGWLSLWLADMGAHVHGFALKPPTSPSFFDVCGIEARLASHQISDVRDRAALSSAIGEARPEIIFHLAAQSLVLLGYESPVDTYETNVMGTVHLLEAARQFAVIRAIVNVTSDKCYSNREENHAYEESEPLGGADPYSSSKACAELVTAAYRNSFLTSSGIATATARAGNVIGGGDWAEHRLIPDFFRALDAKDTLVVRSPNAMRPWQHVLQPVSGYLRLAEALVDEGEQYATSFNFGPEDGDARPVSWIVERMAQSMAGAAWRAEPQPGQPHEATYLAVDSSKAERELGWVPRWPIETALAKTIAWHSAWRRGADMAETSLAQIRDYEAAP